MVLLLMVANSVPAGGGARTAPGAAVLGADPRDDPAGAAVDEVGYLTPDPLRATSDVPDVYADGCHQDQVGAEPLSCTYGDPDGETVVAVAGDSKVAQWLPALQPLAEQHGWKLVTFTKSACSFAAATIRDGDGRPYRSCAEWGQRLLRHLTEVERPDFVITSQGAAQAFGPDGALSEEALVGGLQEVWGALARAGAQVVVIADNPHPGENVYECVDEHRDRLTACTYSRDRRLTRGGYAVQLAATQGQPEVSMVDLFDAICPVDPCAPVIGDVLIYRQGSHITATYVETLAPRLDEALSEAGLPGRPDGQRR
jgi:hypothetical protein